MLKKISFNNNGRNKKGVTGRRAEFMGRKRTVSVEYLISSGIGGC